MTTRATSRGAYRLAAVLAQMGLVPPEELTSLLETCRDDDRRLQDTLVSAGRVSRSHMAEAIARYFEVPFVDLKREKVEPEALALIPEALARRYCVLPLHTTETNLTVVMADPRDIEALESLAIQTGKRVSPMVGVPDEIEHSIDLYYRAGGEIEKEVARLPCEMPGLKAVPGRLSPDMAAQTPVTRIVDLIVEQAVRDRASDIHIEPQEDSLEVRYRVDGLLRPVISLPPHLHPALVSRIKVMAEMNIAERRRPQDGKFSLKVANTDVDVRVATAETACGETVVLRLLNKSMSLLDLPQLGLQPETLEKHQQLISRKYGMVLVSGPTGSGKTTTLYASINALDRQHLNIITIEDPIEYRLQGINQIQVNAKAGLTFATGLRAIMRLDPDVILVGEIRDEETASMAVQAALTGHLVLSSIHANDTASVLVRLLDLGVEPLLICSAVAGVVAQRMVRRMCPHCRVAYEPTLGEQTAYEQELGEIGQFTRGAGCNFCGGTGYLGRIGVFEAMPLSDEIGRRLLSRSGAREIRVQALKEGMMPMRRDGMLKVKQGITTPFEVLRNTFGPL